MRTLVTGANGFVGQHVVRELFEHGMGVVGLGRDVEVEADIADLLIEYVPADLTRPLTTLPPFDVVVHLAGLSAVGASFSAPAKYIAANTAMVINLCEPLINQKKPPKVVIASTGAVYDADQTMPVNESGATAPTSPYVVSKLAVEHLAQYYARRGVPTVIARPFNHFGPGQGPGFLVPDIIEGARRAAAVQGTLKVGNLETARDYTDVRDVASAYRVLLTAETSPGDVFNVCSGSSQTGRHIVQALLEHLGLDGLPLEVDPALVRPTDAARIEGDAGRLMDLGWKRRYELAQTLSDIVAGARP